ncbi:hypothetical protein ACJX0J_007629, partial [Zea mays]
TGNCDLVMFCQKVFQNKQLSSVENSKKAHKWHNLCFEATLKVCGIPHVGYLSGGLFGTTQIYDPVIFCFLAKGCEYVFMGLLVENSKKAHKWHNLCFEATLKVCGIPHVGYLSGGLFGTTQIYDPVIFCFLAKGCEYVFMGLLDGAIFHFWDHVNSLYYLL